MYITPSFRKNNYWKKIFLEDLWTLPVSYHFHLPEESVPSLLTTPSGIPCRDSCLLDPISSCFLVYSLVLVKHILEEPSEKGDKG